MAQITRLGRYFDLHHRPRQAAQSETILRMQVLRERCDWYRSDSLEPQLCQNRGQERWGKSRGEGSSIDS